MGDLDAKRLLIENSKLKIQQNELSSVLGEEKEMVKYLHGVIKNYEQLLRSNSKSNSSSPPAVVKMYHDTDLKTDPKKAHEGDIHTKIESARKKYQIITTQHRKGDATGRLMLPSEQPRNKTPLSLQSCLVRGSEEDSQGFSPYQGVNRPRVYKENVSRSSDDLRLENLENSSSSDDDLVKDNLASFSSGHNIGHNNILNPVHFEEGLSEGQPMGSVGNAPSNKRFNHKYDKESHSGKHQELEAFVNPTLYPNWYCCSKTAHDEIDKKETSSTTRPRSNFTKTTTTSINDNRESELAEMFRELDKMESKLNRYENLVAKSDKRLTKIENKLEYLESFALGEESECL
ncbi:uncharacterized protein LOC116298075 [Actinia tenebrosa]|uniref:Uncharacterized protein LOC116298075 n=1 Tax=Actinia tenebrosa TaxID=6105 RepID=A0A6P8IBQ7_ACTTE|nr:uncharacterized protein LOC116298075 [Actinia tenebrosa]XP_031562285.1 uncharacterized protein LOC116298075 [Actinia tenebrosa]